MRSPAAPGKGSLMPVEVFHAVAVALVPPRPDGKAQRLPGRQGCLHERLLEPDPANIAPALCEVLRDPLLRRVRLVHWCVLTTLPAWSSSCPRSGAAGLAGGRASASTHLCSEPGLAVQRQSLLPQGRARCGARGAGRRQIPHLPPVLRLRHPPRPSKLRRVIWASFQVGAGGPSAGRLTAARTATSAQIKEGGRVRAQYCEMK